MISRAKFRPLSSLTACLILLFLVAPVHAKNEFSPMVETAYGKVQGFVNGDAIVWKGVPYAKPPVDDPAENLYLRWKAPQDPEPWAGVREATLPANKCVQLYTTTEWIRTGAVDPASSEDCLYVDIFRPKHNGRLPVYVYIHGGSNNFGSARDYDGTVLATRSDVVVVVVQYRLGPIGWLYHPALQTGTDPLSDSGNFGTLDHAQALKWIQENISGFGGNPHNITVTGESAGAHNTMNMVISPEGKGLFHRAMSESGGMQTMTPVAGRAQANDIIEKLLMYYDGVATPVPSATRTDYANKRIAKEQDGSLEGYLRGKPAGDLFLAILKYGSVPTFPAIEDGVVMPTGGWIPAIQSGNYNKMPIILGSNEYESKSFMPLYYAYVKPKGVPSSSYTWFNLIDVLKGTKTLDQVLPTQFDKDLYEKTGYFGSRNWKAKYVDTVAHELAKVQDDVYAYLFKWGGIGSGPSPFDFIYGAGHAAEIPFFFGKEQGLFGYPFVPANQDGRKELQKAMMEYLSRFALTGNPNALASCPPGMKGGNGSCLPKWQQWTNKPGDPKAIVFNADFDHAEIGMMEEELTIQGVKDEMNAWVSSLPPEQQGVAGYVTGVFQFSKPW